MSNRNDEKEFRPIHKIEEALSAERQGLILPIIIDIFAIAMLISGTGSYLGILDDNSYYGAGLFIIWLFFGSIAGACSYFIYCGVTGSIAKLKNELAEARKREWTDKQFAELEHRKHNRKKAGIIVSVVLVCGLISMKDAEYRKTLVRLRRHIKIIENDLREKDYTFDYSKQPSKAMFKYRAAFYRNDRERYSAFIDSVSNGEAKLHTGTLTPYDIVAPFLDDRRYTPNSDERKAIDATWNAQEDFTDGENALVVVDGSGSMYCRYDPMPAAVAESLAIYFAERNTGRFKNHFITFSENPQLVEIKGRDIFEKLRYCCSFNEVANTNLQKVFELILDAAVAGDLPQSELPSTLYIISDMEFDSCTEDASLTNFEYAKRLYARHGYTLPKVVFWNVASRNIQQPVTMNEQGVALVSGCSPRVFGMIKNKNYSPYSLMMETLYSERYEKITA